MGITIVTYISICCLVFLFAVGAEPIQDIKTKFSIGPTDQYISPIQWFITKMINCSLCSGFWIGLIFYQSILLACLVSVGSEILTRIIIKL